MNKMRTALVGVTVCAAAIVGTGANAAFAGEFKGNGELKPVNGRSICAYSGLDAPDDVEIGDDDDDFFGRTQSFGQAVRQGLKGFLESEGETPGRLCNPVKGIDLHGAP